MNALRNALTFGALSTLAACAATPQQKAERAAAQQRYEQNLQVALAAQCDPETAALMRRQFEQAAQSPSSASRGSKEFRLKYVDKIADPMFQACYKMAWQNHISQQKLREARYYYDYGGWGWGYPFHRHPFWW